MTRLHADQREERGWWCEARGVHGAGVRGHVASLLLNRARVVGTGPFVDVTVDVTIVVAVVTTRRYHECLPNEDVDDRAECGYNLPMDECHKVHCCFDKDKSVSVYCYKKSLNVFSTFEQKMKISVYLSLTVFALIALSGVVVVLCTR
ncbi:unnamed protein product [Lampetra fluviatilis]